MIQRLSDSDWRQVAGDIAKEQNPLFNWSLETLLRIELSHIWGWKEGRLCAVAIMREVHSTEIEIDLVFTLPEFRHQKVAGRFLSHLIETRRAADFFLEVHEKNSYARSLYQALGFEQVSRRTRYYSDGGDALILKRSAET